MGHLRVLYLLIALVLGAAAKGHEPEPYCALKQAAIAIPFTGHAVGTAVDKYGNVRSPQPPATFQGVIPQQTTKGAVSAEARNYMVTSASDYGNTISASGSISVSGYGAQLTAAGSYFKNTFTQTSHVYILRFVSVSDGQEVQQYDPEPTLHSATITRLQTKGPVIFEQEYGRSFVSGYRRQKWLSAIIDISTEYSGSKSTVAAKLSTSLNRWGVDAGGNANFGEEFNQATYNMKVDMSLFGAGLSQPVIIGSNKPSDLLEQFNAVWRNVSNSIGEPFDSLLYEFARLQGYAQALRDGRHNPLPADPSQHWDILNILEKTYSYITTLDYQERQIRDLWTDIPNRAGLWDKILTASTAANNVLNDTRFMVQINDSRWQQDRTTINDAIGFVAAAVKKHLDTHQADYYAPGFDDGFAPLCAAFSGWSSAYVLRGLEPDTKWRWEVLGNFRGSVVGMQWADPPPAEQQFALVYGGNLSYQFRPVSVRDTGVCVRDASTSADAQLIVWNCQGSNEAYWFIRCRKCTRTHGSECKIMNKNSKMCVVAAWQGDNSLLQRPCHLNDDLMYWRIDARDIMS